MSRTNIVSGLLYISRNNGNETINVVQRSAVISALGNLSTIEEQKEFYGYLFFLNYYCNQLFCQVIPEYATYESDIFSILEIEYRDFYVEFYIWEDCCPFSGDTNCETPPGGGPNGKWIFCQKYFIQTGPGEGTNWLTNGSTGSTWWLYDGTTNPGGGGGSRPSTPNPLDFFNDLDVITKRLVEIKTNDFISEHDLEVNHEELIDLIGFDCYDLVEQDGFIEDVTLDANCAKDELFDLIDDNLSLADNESFLKSNPNEIIKINSFLENHNDGEESEQNLSLAVANAYADIIEDGIDLLELGENDNVLFSIMKEQLLILIKELLADFIPGGTLVTLGPELLDNMSSGNWMDAMYNAIDIVLNEADAFFPAAKIASTGLALAINAKHLSKFWKAIDKLKVLGTDVLNKVFQALNSKLGDKIFDSFSWVNQSHGSNLKNIGDPLDFWDELVTIFGGAVTGGNGNELVLSNIPGLPHITIRFYPASTTPPHCPTISIKNNTGFEFKIRFCD